MNYVDYEMNTEDIEITRQESLFFAQVLITLKNIMANEMQTNATLRHSIDNNDKVGVDSWLSACVPKAMMSVLINQDRLIETLIDKYHTNPIPRQLWEDINKQEVSA